MDWIKKNFEKFALLVISVALLVVAVLLFLNEQSFLKSFDSLKVAPFESDKMPPLDTSSVAAAQASLDKPTTWDFDPKQQGYLLVSRPYVVEDGGAFTELGIKGMFYPPVPNDWITKYGLNLLDPNILSEDTDGNGFTNLEKWKAGSDPTDKNSHPAYTTKLFLERYIQVPFRLVFNGQPDATSYQIDTLDVHQPTQILQMGDPIAGTKYKIVDFQHKTKIDENGIEKDVSELTIQNTETNAKVVLVFGVTGNDPDSYALFKYLWEGSTEIEVKLGADFSLKPEKDVTYKLIDINQKEAKIENLKTTDQITIPHL